MLIKLDTRDLIEFVSLIPQYIKKIGGYQPMCGDDFAFDEEGLGKHCRDFLTMHRDEAVVVVQKMTDALKNELFIDR